MSDFFTYSHLFNRLFLECGERVKYEKDQYVVWSKEENGWVYFLETGLVRASFALPDSTHRIIGYFVPGMVFAKSGSFLNDADGTLSYTATTDVTVLRMRSKSFRTHLAKRQDLMEEYMNMTLRNQKFLVDRIVYSGEKGLHLKCVRWLLFMAKYYGQTEGLTCEITVPLPQAVAADFLHSTRESTNVALRRLEKEHVIKLATRKILITDIKKLRALVE